MPKPNSTTPDNPTNDWRFKHGKTGTPEHVAWINMRGRCYNPKADSYALYSGRGTAVCDGWRDGSAVFIADVGPRPSPEHSIERIDNNGNYSCGHCDQCRLNSWPANVKWATPAEQCRNRRSNRWLTLNGETLCMQDWADRLGIRRLTLKRRIDVYGWSEERALTEPIQTQYSHPKP